MPVKNEISSYGYKDEISNFDKCLTGNKVQANTMRIYDITHGQYEKYDYALCSFLSSSEDKNANDFLGIVPIVVTPTNALFF